MLSPLSAADALKSQTERFVRDDDPAAQPSPYGVEPRPPMGADQYAEGAEGDPYAMIDRPVLELPRIDTQGRSAPEYDSRRANLLRLVASLAAAGTAATAGRSPRTAAIAQGILQGTAAGKQQMDEEYLAEQRAFSEWLTGAQEYNREAQATEAEMEYNAKTDQYEYQRGRRDDMMDRRAEQHNRLERIEAEGEQDTNRAAAREWMEQRDPANEALADQRQASAFANRQRGEYYQRRQAGDEGSDQEADTPEAQEIRRVMGRKSAELEAIEEELAEESSVSDAASMQGQSVDDAYVRQLKKERLELRRELKGLEYDLREQTGTPADTSIMNGQGVDRTIEAQDLRGVRSRLDSINQEQGREATERELYRLMQSGNLTEQQVNALYAEIFGQ